MSKVEFCCLLIVLLQTLACKAPITQSVEDEKPNIVFIMVDDLGKEWISAYGAEDIETPNIDALAKNGVIFNNAYAMPQCTPSRVTLLTGQYPFRHGWVNHWDVPRWGGGAHFDEKLNPSLGIEMKKAGYTNCVAGKWQIDDFRVEPDAMVNNGFDAYCMWTGYETGVKESANRYQDPYIFSSEGSKTYQGAFGPDVFTDYITNFISTHKDNPFFVYYPMVLTHTPFVDTPDESHENKIDKHKAMVRYADKLTGKIIQALKEAGVLENTIIVWTTDNGSTGQITGGYQGRQIKGGKSKTKESGINVPFIVSFPSQMKGNQSSEALIDFSDIYPTFLDIAGIPPSKKIDVNGKEHIIDGYSFKDVIYKDPTRSNRTWILGMGGGNNAKLTEKGVENQYVYRDRVLRNERYKLYIGSDKKAQKFIDLNEDPEEKRNLTDSLEIDQRKENFESLWKIAETFPARDSDPKYHPNPSQDWDVKISAESQKWKRN